MNVDSYSCVRATRQSWNILISFDWDSFTNIFPEADRLNKSNREIGEMRAPNISKDNGLFL